MTASLTYHVLRIFASNSMIRPPTFNNIEKTTLETGSGRRQLSPQESTVDRIIFLTRSINISSSRSLWWGSHGDRDMHPGLRYAGRRVHRGSTMWEAHEAGFELLYPEQSA